MFFKKSLSKNAVKSYLLPTNSQFKQMMPGEWWHCKNIMSGNRPPRGKIYKKGVSRFNGRSWKETGKGINEFLPNN